MVDDSVAEHPKRIRVRKDEERRRLWNGYHLRTSIHTHTKGIIRRVYTSTVQTEVIRICEIFIYQSIIISHVDLEKVFIGYLAWWLKLGHSSGSCTGCLALFFIGHLFFFLADFIVCFISFHFVVFCFVFLNFLFDVRTFFVS